MCPPYPPRPPPADDHDNPPPKTVQGYKFNIFYPDLLDRARAPRYFLEPADSKEFAIIRFHAGPPCEWLGGGWGGGS